MLIYCFGHTKSESDFFYVPDIFKTKVQTGFWVQNYLCNLCFVLWIPKGYYNQFTKYTNTFLLFDLDKFLSRGKIYISVLFNWL